jgi:serine/threonine protein kinase
LLNKKGQVKLADFGISAFLDADETRRRTQIGSPFWMSPELILGEGYSYKTDIWSLGITILEMTEVEHTFFEQNPLTVCHTSITPSCSPLLFLVCSSRAEAAHMLWN